jgi:hypothetical protein
MRHSSTTAIRAVALFAMATSPASSQEVPSPEVFIRPPAEIGASGAVAHSMEVHPAPPAPMPPPIDPTTATQDRPAGHSLAIAPRASVVVPRQVSRTESGPGLRPSPFDGIGPVIGAGSPGLSIEPPVVEVQPPLIDQGTPVVSEIGIGLGSGTAPTVGSPRISPPLSLGDEDKPSANPLLPAGPETDRKGRDSLRRDDRERLPRTERIPQDRGRSGLIGGLFDRIFDRSPPPISPRDRVVGRDGSVSRLESGSGSASAIGRDDPIAVEAIRKDLERRIIAATGDRISTLEVLIVGRRVHIRAQSSRLWQRRALRRDLESIPMPTSFRSSVEVR